MFCIHTVIYCSLKFLLISYVLGLAPLKLPLLLVAAEAAARGRSKINENYRVINKMRQ